MRIVCLGGGPAGLYFSILIKQALPACQVRVIERLAEGDTYGWGVVLSDQVLEQIEGIDPETQQRINEALYHWDDIHIHYRGQCHISTGHGFSGISRPRLLAALYQRARTLGVELCFEQEAAPPDQYADADLIVAADGIHSAVRAQFASIFQPQIDVGACRYLWLGADCALPAFTFDFHETASGWVTLHAYRHDENESTFIVEMPEAVWQGNGLDRISANAAAAWCQALFSDRLQGAQLRTLSRHSRGGEWLRFNRLVCKRWHHENIVLLGDAAHTAHFSIGSGTRLAMEDAIALVHALTDPDEPLGDIPSRLAHYQARREPEVLRLQSAARNRQQWFEQVASHTTQPPLQFCYSLLTGSQRLGHDNLRQRDPAFVQAVEADLAARSGADAPNTPPLFTPFQLGPLRLNNRIAVSPMATYAAQDGLPGDFHLTHLGARALGGAGLIWTEMTAPCPEGRITPACTGLWNDAQTAAWQRIVEFIHQNSSAAIGLQLGHAGPKGATCLPWQGQPDQPLPAEEAWPLVAASSLPWRPTSTLPSALNEAGMTRLCDAFAAAAQRALSAGFDLLELHCAHGYLLSSFLSPLSNQRNDAYSGSLENRLRFPLQVFRTLRAHWPRPLAVRISAHDWMPGGNTEEDALAMARAFQAAGADLIDVSSGQTHPEARPRYGRMYQTPFADRIRNELGMATQAVGAITSADQANTIIAAGRADLCALGRPHLSNPHWTLHAAAELGWPLPWPSAYQPGGAQLQKQLHPEPTLGDRS